MSSILKALKKLENDAPNQDVFIPWPQHIRRKPNGVARAGRTRKIVKTGSLIVVLLIFLASGMLWFVKKQGSVDGPNSGKVLSRLDQETKKPAAATKMPFNPPAPPSSASEKKPPLVIKPDKLRVEKPKPEKSPIGSPRSQRRTTPSKPPVKASPNPKEAPPSKPLGESYQGKKFESFKKAQSPPIERDVKPSMPILKSDQAEKSDTVPQTQAPPIELMEGNRLKLDAIAWSDDPKKRIAVINGRIVREGESIEGYVLMRIDADEIIVREGGKSWRLVFRIH